MATIKVTCFRAPASTNDHRRVYDLDPMLRLSEVRTQLTTDGFLPPDNNNDVAYRFVDAQSESTSLEDPVIRLSVEDLIPLAAVLGKANQLITVNTLAK